MGNIAGLNFCSFNPMKYFVGAISQYIGQEDCMVTFDTISNEVIILCGKAFRPKPQKTQMFSPVKVSAFTMYKYIAHIHN